MKKLLTILIILTVFFAFDIPSVVEAQSSNQAPSAEQPQVGKKDEDKPEARNRDKKKKARPSPSPTTEQSSTQTTSLFQIIVRRVFSIIPDVTSSPTPRPSAASQPQGEQPRAEEKKDDTSRTKRSEKKKASPSPSPTTEQSSTQTTSFLGGFVERIFSTISSVVSNVASTPAPTPRPSPTPRVDEEEQRRQEEFNRRLRERNAEQPGSDMDDYNRSTGERTPAPSSSPTHTPSATSSPTPTSVPTSSPSPTPRVDEEERRRQEEFMKRLRERNAEQPGSDDELGSRGSTPSPNPTSTSSPTPTPTPVSTQTSVSVGKIKKTNLQYPIKELGNCKKEADCKKYCDLKENIKRCAEFGKKTGLMTAQEAETAEMIANITNGPNGCTDKESCAKVCDEPKNTNACLEYAKKNNLMTDDELEKAKKVAGIISAGSKTPGGCQTPQVCREYCTGGAHVDECIEFARGAGLISGDEAKEMGKGRDFLKNGGPGGCKSREECESYCDDESRQSECEAFFKNAGVPDSKPRDKSGKPPKTGGGAVCTTREECEAFCKNPANAETCKNVVIKGGQTTGPEIQGDIGKLLENINQMPQESKECLKGALGAETFEKLMRGEMPTSPIGGDVMQSCFAKGVEEYEQKAMPTKKPDDFSLEYGPGPSSQAIPGGVPEEIPPGQPGEAGGVPEVQGVSVTPSLLDKILDWLRR